MRRHVKLFSLITVFLSAVLSLSAETKFTVIPPRAAEAGRHFSVVFRLENANANDPKVGDIIGCKFLYGPSKSTSQSYVFSNGTQTSTSTIDYTYTYSTDSAGVYTIPSATISVNGKLMKTEPVKFQVFPSNRPANSSQQSNNNQGGNFAPMKTGASLSKSDVFIRMIPNRTTVYEQEPVECTVKLYTKYRQIQNFRAVSQPNFDGCLIEEIPVTPTLDNVEEYNGQTYSTAILKKVIIFPQKSGKLTLNSGKYDITVMQYERYNTFFGQQLVPTGEEEIHVNPGDLTINVTPLPVSNRPSDFSGAVGNFNVTSKLSNDHLRTNEAATLTYTISGTGNIRYLKEPVVEFPEEFEQYAPKAETNAHISGANVAGTMTVEYTFVPQAAGEYIIPGSSFVYFNPVTKEYVTVPVPSQKINVARGAGVSTTVAPEQMRLDQGMTDILHIKNGVHNMSKSHYLLVYTGLYWVILGGMLILFIGYVIQKTRNEKRKSDVAGLRLAKAGKVARKRLKNARAALSSHDGGERFYNEILTALWGYLSDKLGIPSALLTRDNISDKLSQRNLHQETINQVIDILDQCEMARYTPESMSHDKMKSVLGETEQVMESIEKSK